jgi:hypothetical protein
MGALALRATGEESAGFRLDVSANNQLIGMASAKLAGFAVQFPTNGSDLSNLSVHRSLLQKVMPMSRATSVILR